MIPVCVGLGAYWAGRRIGSTRPLVGAVVAVVLMVEPMVGAACAAVVVANLRWRRARAATRRRRAADSDVAVLADLVVLGVSAGLSLRSAMEEARRHVVPDLSTEGAELVSTMDRTGVASALATVRGRLEGFGRVAAAAAVSGAPIGAAVAAFASTLRHAEHTAAVERARRLPVRMLLPLALLILPGFVVLAVGPAVMQSLARLGPIP